MTEQEIEYYLQALNEELAHRAIEKPVRLAIVGGVYMVALVGNRASTKDIDIIPLSFPDTMNQDKQTRVFRSAANAVAKSYRIKRDWINDVVAAFAPDPGPLTLWRNYSHLLVYAPSAEYILALKLLSGRDRDEEDILALCKKLHIQTCEQAQTLVDRYASPQWQKECNLQATLDALF
jgi:hypothetical protein